MQSMDLAALLRRLPHSLQRCPDVSYAVEAHRAMTQQGGLAFLQLHSRGTWMQQAIMLPRLQQVCNTKCGKAVSTCLDQSHTHVSQHIEPGSKP